MNRPAQDQVNQYSYFGGLLIILDDYVWLGKEGDLIFFGNEHNPPFWDTTFGIIFVPGLLMDGHTRKDVHLADCKCTITKSDVFCLREFS